jgi:hypothetical protein
MIGSGAWCNGVGVKPRAHHLDVHVQLATVQVTTPVTVSWRVVHLLMPYNPARLPLHIQSATKRACPIPP